MSFWDFLHMSPRATPALLQQLHSKYEPPFSVHVREQLGGWIEKNLTNSNLNAQNPADYAGICQLLNYLRARIDAEVERLIREMPGAHVVRCDLQHASSLLQNVLLSPEAVRVFYAQIRFVLNIESGLFQQFQVQGSDLEMYITSIQQNLAGASIPQQSIQNLAHGQDHADSSGAHKHVFPDIRAAMQELRHNVNGSLQLFQRMQGQLQDMNVENGRLNEFMTFVRVILTLSRSLFSDNIQKKLLALRRGTALTWTPAMLDTFQNHCSEFAEVLHDCRVLLSELQRLFPDALTQLSDLQDQFAELVRTFESLSFIVETQPCEVSRPKDTSAPGVNRSQSIELETQPKKRKRVHSQVILKNSKFNAKVRFLAGTPSMRIGSSSRVEFGPVTAELVMIDEIRRLVGTVIVMDSDSNTESAEQPNSRRKAKGAAKKEKAESTLELTNEAGYPVQIVADGEVVNNTADLDRRKNARFSAQFQTAEIKKKKHASEHEPGQSVVDEAYWILFHMLITENFNGKTHQRRVWTASTPIKVIVNTSQRAQAFETLIWLNAMDPCMLYSPRTKLGKLPPLPWSNVVRELNRMCTEMTGCPLTAEQQDGLRQKAFSVPNENESEEVADGHFTFYQFCKKELKENKKKEDGSKTKPFHFWGWFYATLKLAEKHLCGDERRIGVWQAGCVAGFMDREQTECKLLLAGQVGSFLLRFSDSVLGGVTVVGLQHNGFELVPISIGPWNADDLCKRPLAEKIMDLAVLSHLYLYQNGGLVPKEDVFSLYLQKEDSNDVVTDLRRQYWQTDLQTIIRFPELTISPPSDSSCAPQSVQDHELNEEGVVSSSRAAYGASYQPEASGPDSHSPVGDILMDLDQIQ